MCDNNIIINGNVNSLSLVAKVHLLVDCFVKKKNQRDNRHNSILKQTENNERQKPK